MGIRTNEGREMKTENITVNGIEYCPVVEKLDEWKLPEYADGSKFIVSGGARVYEDDTKSYTEMGRRRATKELADRCYKASKTRDLLEAYRDHIEPTWEDECPGRVYYIYINTAEEYSIKSNYINRTMGTVYGSEKTMGKIADALNKGEISL